MRLDSKQQFLEESAGGKRCYCACEGTEGGPAALYGEITVKDGAVQQGNFDDYPIARIFDAPDTEVYVLTNDQVPTGCGEPGVPPIAPAITNALFAATGQRIRKLPIRLT